MATTDVIVVAPNTVFRRSIVFVLESGGFRAVPHVSLEAALALSEIRGVGCAVVDEAAIHDGQRASKLFRRFAKPTILLVSRFRTTPDTLFVRHIAKPLLGEPLLEAVRKAIGGIDPDT